MAGTIISASSAKVASGQTGAITPSSTADDRLNVQVNVTAASGTTPTLDLSVEWSFDGSTWAVAQPADSFTQIATNVGAVVKQFAMKAPTYRLRWVLGGTSPSFTFSATAWTYDD